MPYSYTFGNKTKNTMNTYFQTSEKVAVQDYPYGRHRTTAFFSLEYRAGHGFRSVFQTVNPKTGRLNAEKKSIYSPVMLMYKDGDTGHIKYSVRGMNGRGELNELAPFLAEHWHLFSAAEQKGIIQDFIGWSVADMKAVCVYGGAKPEDVAPFYKENVARLKAALDCPSNNVWAGVKYDEAGIDSMKPEGYNPFRVTVQEMR